MVVSQWASLWPAQEQARSEILEWFNARVGNLVRQQTFTPDDLRWVYRSERALQLLYDKLQQVELKRVPRIDNLLYFMQNTAKRLEVGNNAAKQRVSEPMNMPSMVYLSVSESAPVEPQWPDPSSDIAESDLSAPPPPAPTNGEIRLRPAPRFWMMWGFCAGVLSCLLIVLGVYFVQIKPMQQQWSALAEKPEGLAQLWLIAPKAASYPQQLNRLENASPLAGLRAADLSVALARQQWPTDPAQQAESQRWERLLQARRGDGVDSHYFLLQQRLAALSAKLLEQEQTRGSLTISYLKTAVYDMQTELNGEAPLEELLRQLSVAVQSQQPASPLLMKQIDERWNTLLSRYHQLTQQADAIR
jgi:type VI secretion system protein VasL